MKQRIPSLDEFINEGGVKDKMFEMIDEIIEIFTDAKGSKAKNIAKEIEKVSGYDPTNENEDDFMNAMWALDFQDLESILSAIRKRLAENENLLESEELIHFAWLMPNGNYAVSIANTEDEIKKQVKTTGADNYKIVGKSGSYKEDQKQFDKINNLAHAEGKKMAK